MIPMATVKSLCTAAEAQLVRASRTPEISKLSAIEAGRNATRARKLFDKWQVQARQQARASSGKSGSPEGNERTQIKEQIFKDAIEQFETRAKELQSPRQPQEASARTTKTAATGSTSAGSTGAAESSTKPARSNQLRSFTPPSGGSSLAAMVTMPAAAKRNQLGARSAAIQARVNESGLRSRVHGHIAARGKRNQAKRDAR